MRKYTKYVVVAGSLAALAVPSAAMASQPADPGGFGQDRAATIQGVLPGLNGGGGAAWGAIASQRAGDNGTINNNYKVMHGDVPAESSLSVTPVS